MTVTRTATERSSSQSNRSHRGRRGEGNQHHQRHPVLIPQYKACLCLTAGPGARRGRIRLDCKGAAANGSCTAIELATGNVEYGRVWQFGVQGYTKHVEGCSHTHRTCARKLPASPRPAGHPAWAGHPSYRQYDLRFQGSSATATVRSPRLRPRRRRRPNPNA